MTPAKIPARFEVLKSIVNTLAAGKEPTEKETAEALGAALDIGLQLLVDISRIAAALEMRTGPREYESRTERPPAR